MIQELNNINHQVEIFIEKVEDYLKNPEISFNERLNFFKDLPIKYKFHERFILTKAKGYPAIENIIKSDWIDIHDIKRGTSIECLSFVSYHFYTLFDYCLENNIEVNTIDNIKELGLDIEEEYTLEDYQLDIAIIKELMLSNIGVMNYDW